ncbi:MAG: von Willebrand factor type A domain-containing protein [Oscillospiraceae bacterium]|nr:von Willebrand factor type A domain-containing protein [Oscillospiraceae bacterium]
MNTTRTRKAAVSALLITSLLLSLTGCGAKNETVSPSRKVSQNMQGLEGVQYEACDAAIEGFYADDMNSESYAPITENGFQNTADAPLSTFSADVDTASYSNVRRMLRSGQEIPSGAVRIEEMINYFHYSYPAPTDGAPLSVTTEMYDCPWNPDNQLFLVGLQAEEIDMAGRQPMNLVFLIDVSGSMYCADKLPLVQNAINMLAPELNEHDRISIVTYAGQESVVLEGCSGADQNAITDAINSLEAGGATAGEAGIRKAYEIAEKNFIEGGNNRVMLATDGDLNVGISTPEELKKLVEEKRRSGVFLSVLGFGQGNIKDDNMETLADNGNGAYAYIDSELEARKVLVQEMGGTLYTVAKDVKLQVGFDPEMVESYRLIGYENRLLADEDFANDQVDAGEIGSGHSVTALYELVLTGQGKQEVQNQNDVCKQSSADAGQETVNAPLLTVSMRYKAPDGDESQLREYPVTVKDCYTGQISRNLAFAAAVTEFGMIVGDRERYGASYDQIKELLGRTDLQDSYRQEFAELVEYLK